MKFAHRTSRERTLDIEITSMVDIVFLLIIFFMTTAQFAEETRAELDLARQQGEQRDVADEAGLVVNILADGTIIIGDTTVALGDLDTFVRREMVNQDLNNPTEFKMTIRADRNAAAGHLNEVVRRLRTLDVGMARLATEEPN
ncbi:MAG: biopolymer transporter ExbD [Phycisphaerales bacterium]|nr:biopolymer transporter ExbD [Phycisphaerales bacterium]